MERERSVSGIPGVVPVNRERLRINLSKEVSDVEGHNHK
jgi:hypothetical protein